MKPRFVLSPEAADDLVDIWQYIREQSNIETADRVESVTRDQILFLARNPNRPLAKRPDRSSGAILSGLLLFDRLSS